MTGLGSSTVAKHTLRIAVTSSRLQNGKPSPSRWSDRIRRPNGAPWQHRSICLLHGAFVGMFQLQQVSYDHICINDLRLSLGLYILLRFRSGFGLGGATVFVSRRALVGRSEAASEMRLRCVDLSRTRYSSDRCRTSTFCSMVTVCRWVFFFLPSMEAITRKSDGSCSNRILSQLRSIVYLRVSF